MKFTDLKQFFFNQGYTILKVVYINDEEIFNFYNPIKKEGININIEFY